MVVFPNAKINFGLNIVSKRADGYHDIESIFYPIGLCDSLEITLAEDTQFLVHGLEIPGNPADNLILKAWQIMQQRFSLPNVRIDLLKHIPMGGGVGGGSADCGFFINLVNTFFKLQLSEKESEEIALSLGSDCPFFIKNSPSLVSGRGDVMESIPTFLRGYYLVLVYGGLHINTKDAYAGITPTQPKHSLRDVLSDAPETWSAKVRNDFELPVFERFPELRKIKQELVQNGAVYASLTGTGSCLYGIYKEKPHLTNRLESISCWQGLL